MEKRAVGLMLETVFGALCDQIKGVDWQNIAQYPQVMRRVGNHLVNSMHQTEKFMDETITELVRSELPEHRLMGDSRIDD